MGNVSKSIQIELPITLEEFGIFVLHDFADVAGEADDNSLIQIKQKINSCYINIEASKVIRSTIKTENNRIVSWNNLTRK